MCGNAEIVSLERLEKIACIEKMFVGYEPRFLDVTHTFLNGVYTRSGKIKQGEFVIGFTHKKKNFLHLATGKLAMWDNVNGFRILTAPHSEVSTPGIRRIAFALETTTGSNIMETEKNTVEDVESEMFEPFVLPANVGEKIVKLLEHANENQVKQIATAS